MNLFMKFSQLQSTTRVVKFEPPRFERVPATTQAQQDALIKRIGKLMNGG